MNNSTRYIWMSVAALCVWSLVWAQESRSTPPMAVLQTNWDGSLEWVLRTNAPVRTNREYLSPSETARVYVSLLDAHMAAVSYQWVVTPESRRRYEEYVDRLIQATWTAPMSDQERHAAELRERELRQTLEDRDRAIATLQATRVRLTNEIARLNRELERKQK